MRGQNVKILFMDIADIDEVLSIERASFANPWTKNMFLQELQFHFSQSMVAKIEGHSKTQIVGYIIYWLISGESHLQKIATKPDFRRYGISSILMQEMIRHSLENNCIFCFLEVRKSNQQAIKLYEKSGFSVRGIRPMYYSETGEDAVIMAADLRKSKKLIQHE